MATAVKTPTNDELEQAFAVIGRALKQPPPRKRGGRQGALAGISGMFVTVVDANGNVIQAASPLFTDPIDRAARLAGRFSVGVGDSLQAAGKVTAPGLGGAICTLAAPPAGIYKVEVDLKVSNATDVNNMKIQRGGVDLYNPILVGDTNVSEHEYRITLSGAQNLTINAIAAGGAAVVYLAQIIATRIE